MGSSGGGGGGGGVTGNAAVLNTLTMAANTLPEWTGAATAVTLDVTTDWLSQYALLAGRVGGQILIGGGAAGQTLRLQGNSTSTIDGAVNTLAPLRLNDIAAQTLTADLAPVLRFRQTRTLNFASASLGGGGLATLPGVWAREDTVTLQQSGAAFTTAMLSNTSTVRNANAVVANIGQCSTFNSRPTVTADGAAITLAPSADFFSRLTLSTVNAGALTASGSGDLVAFEAGFTIADTGVNWSAGGWVGFAVVAPTLNGASVGIIKGVRIVLGAGSATANTGVEVQAITGAGTNIGIDVAAPTGGTTNIGIRSAGSILHTGSTGLGYGTGAGGTVTQATSRTTAVTLNKVCGAITLFGAAGVGTTTSFTVNNTTVVATDCIEICQASGTDKYNVWVSAVGAGSFVVSFQDTNGTTNESPVFNFFVNKSVTA